jgi:hypothetical protein
LEKPDTHISTTVFAPSSSPKSWLIDSDQGTDEWSDWDPRTVKNSVDKLEKTVRGFGGGAAEVNKMFDCICLLK